MSNQKGFSYILIFIVVLLFILAVGAVILFKVTLPTNKTSNKMSTLNNVSSNVKNPDVQYSDDNLSVVYSYTPMPDLSAGNVSSINQKAILNKSSLDGSSSITLNFSSDGRIADDSFQISKNGKFVGYSYGNAIFVASVENLTAPMKVIEFTDKSEQLANFKFSEDGSKIAVMTRYDLSPVKGQAELLPLALHLPVLEKLFYIVNSDGTNKQQIKKVSDDEGLLGLNLSDNALYTFNVGGLGKNDIIYQNDLSTGNVKSTGSVSFTALPGPFSPDYKKVYYASEDKAKLIEYDIFNNKEKVIYKPDYTDIFPNVILLSPNGSEVIFFYTKNIDKSNSINTKNPSFLEVISLKDGSVQEFNFPIEDQYNDPISISPGGRYIWFSYKFSRQPNVQIYDTQTKTLTPFNRPELKNVWSHEFLGWISSK